MFTIIRNRYQKFSNWQRLALALILIVSNFATMMMVNAAPLKADIQPSFPIRAAFYYPWFSEAWNQQGFNPFTNYAPSLGFYDLTNQTILSQEIAMQYAGIQAGIASWWGQGTKTDSRIPALLQTAAITSFRWTIYYEPESLGDPSVSQLTNDLTYIRDHYGNDPSFLRIGGRFVIFVYADGADACGMADRWKQANTVGAYVVLKVFSGYSACASQPDGWHQYAPAVAADSQKSHSYAISPGFWKKGETVRLARDLTRWNQNIRDMVASGAPFQLVTTFNEWGEGTSVESAAEWASPSGYGAYLDALHNNGGVPSQPTATTVSSQPTATMVSSQPTATSTALSIPIATSSSSSTTLSFVAEADAQVKEASPNTNYGKFKTLLVDGATDPDVDGYLRFTVSGVSGPIQSAKLRVFDTTNASNNGPAVYGTTNAWTETGITWNTRPARTSSAVDNKVAVATASWMDYNVTALVTGNGTYSFDLGADSTDGTTFSSREGSAPPQLVLIFGTGTISTTVPVATLVPTQPAASTSTLTSILTATPTSTQLISLTSTPTNVPAATSVSTQTANPTSTLSNILSATPTLVQIASPTDTATTIPSATFTPTRTATATFTFTPTATKTATSIPTSIPNTSGIQHVFVVVMENHSYNEVWNTSSSPYITSLGNSFARATNYHATTHPSLPNYLDLYGGSNYGITTDCNPSTSCHSTAVNLADNLDAKGLTWKGYMESMPSPCYLTTSGTYAPKHNPMVYFDDIYTNATRCKAHDVPYTALATDLASKSTTPNYSLIVPNLCNDMHDCSVTTGDTWLKNNLPAILNSPACTVDKCLLILTWDEDDSSQSNQVLTIFAGSAAKTGGVTSGVSYTHFSMLRTVENIFGLPTQTSNDAGASPMNDLLR
jgi:hypothetical protein